MNRIHFNKIDNRTRAERQAAKMLGVSLKGTALCQAGAMYEADRWYAEAYETTDGRVLVVSQNVTHFSAALADGKEFCRPAWLERDAMSEMCVSYDVLDQRGLRAAEADERECAKFG